MTRISAVIAAFNAERHVAAAIDSMLAQTRPPDEIIAVDDGSTDGTVAVLRRFASRATILALPHRGGPAAFAAGVAAATGDVLAFNDADDLWAPSKLAIQLAQLQADPAQHAVFGAVRQFMDFDRAAEPTTALPPQPGIHKIGMLIQRSAFMRFGGFDPDLRFMEFSDWYARALDGGLRATRHADVVAYRRLHAGNIGRLRRQETRDEHLVVLKRLLDAKRRSGQRDRVDQQAQEPDVGGQPDRDG